MLRHDMNVPLATVLVSRNAQIIAIMEQFTAQGVIIPAKSAKDVQHAVDVEP